MINVARQPAFKTSHITMRSKHTNTQPNDVIAKSINIVFVPLSIVTKCGYKNKSILTKNEMADFMSWAIFIAQKNFHSFFICVDVLASAVPLRDKGCE